jgi:Rieske 2Fe-2S family protein
VSQTIPSTSYVSVERLSNAIHAPGSVYGSEAIYRQEVDQLFMKEWLYVAREEEIGKPGDFMALNLLGEPIVITRDTQMQVNAFFNMCAHRGVEVAYGQGNTRAFKCPYHGWTYDINGRLKGAHEMDRSEQFDPVKCGLRTIRVGTWRRNVFVCFSDEAAPLEQYVSEFEKDFAFLHMEKCRLGNKIRIELNCNWKLVHENLMDFYHVNILHAKTFGARFSWEDDDVMVKENGGLSIRYKAGPPTPGLQMLLPKMPWLAQEEESFATKGYLSPNFAMFGRIDCVRPMIVWPIAVDKSEIIIYQLFPDEVFERPDIEDTLKTYREYQLLVLEEDRSMIESLQRAMNTRGYRPGPMSVREKPLHHFLTSHALRLSEGAEKKDE